MTRDTVDYSQKGMHSFRERLEGHQKLFQSSRLSKAQTTNTSAYTLNPHTPAHHRREQRQAHIIMPPKGQVARGGPRQPAPKGFARSTYDELVNPENRQVLTALGVFAVCALPIRFHVEEDMC